MRWSSGRYWLTDARGPAGEFPLSPRQRAKQIYSSFFLLGFESSHIVTFSVDPDMAKYKPEQAAELQRRLIEGARELPDVESAAISNRGLMRGTGLKMTVARSGERAGPEEFMNTSIHFVSPNILPLCGLRGSRGATSQVGRTPRQLRSRSL